MSGSFSQQLEDLLNPQPKFADPEDDGDEETKARVIEKFNEDDDEEEEEGDGAGGVGLSALRKHTASLLSDTDRRYAGKAVSRKQLMRDMEGSEEEEEEDDDEEDGDEEEGDEEEAEDGDEDEEEDEDADDVTEEQDLDKDDEDNDINDDDNNLNDSEVTFPKEVDFHKLTEGMDDLGVSEEEEEEEEEEDSGEESEEDEEEESSEDDDMEQDDSTVRTFSQDKVEEEVEKGKAVKNQLALWDQLLEGRIKIQKALATANQLPQPPTFPQFKSCAEFTGALKNSHKALKALQRSLLELHDHLLVQNPDTKAISLGEHDDEEIISDEDDGPDKRTPKRKLEMAEYPDFMAKRFAAFTPYQNATLQKWHDKTRLTMGKSSKSFGAFERNILTQIEQVLMDKDRLIRRTQTRRSEYKVMGKQENALTTESALVEGEEPEQQQLKSNSHLKDLDEDIFDDDDFYHQLLRELIERKTSAADPNDQVAMGKQWLAIQKLRSKIKKKVDTKASKGRKVRYHVHSKLVNFMAPIDHSSMGDEARSELYRGLFGQNSTVRE